VLSRHKKSFSYSILLSEKPGSGKFYANLIFIIPFLSVDV
jgi:hypothetical protein